MEELLKWLKSIDVCKRVKPIPHDDTEDNLQARRNGYRMALDDIMSELVNRR